MYSLRDSYFMYFIINGSFLDESPFCTVDSDKIHLHELKKYFYKNVHASHWCNPGMDSRSVPSYMCVGFHVLIVKAHDENIPQSNIRQRIHPLIKEKEIDINAQVETILVDTLLSSFY